MSQQYQRIIKKRGGVYLTDLDGNILPPEVAEEAGKELLQTIKKRSYVYVGPREDGMYKIGFTIRPNERPDEVGLSQVDHLIECPFYGPLSGMKIEKTLHDFFKSTSQHVEGEWFDLGQHGLMLFKDYFTTPEKVFKYVQMFYEHQDKVIAMLRQVTYKPSAFAMLLAKAYQGEIADEDYVYTIYYLAKDAIRNWTKTGKIENATFVAGALGLIYEMSDGWLSERYLKKSETESSS